MGNLPVAAYYHRMQMRKLKALAAGPYVDSRFSCMVILLITHSNRFDKDIGKSFPLLYGQAQSTILASSTPHCKTDQTQSSQQHGIRLWFRNGRSDI